MLSKVCNAPKNSGGVYLVSKINKAEESLIYIGSSGWISKDGTFHTRVGGLFDRLVNGKQFDAKRSKSWPAKMKEENIEMLGVHWYVTFDNNNKDIPAFVEASLLQEYFQKNHSLPFWNKDF